MGIKFTVFPLCRGVLIAFAVLIPHCYFILPKLLLILICIGSKFQLNELP